MSAASPTPEIPSTRLASDRRLLTAIKVIFALIFVGFLIVGDNDTTWPLVTWPMFDSSGSKMPTSASSLRVRAVSADGQTDDFMMDDLFKTLSASASEKIVRMTFDDALAAPEREAAQTKLTAMVRSLLPTLKIVEIQTWKLTWTVDLNASEQLGLATPSAQKMLGTFTPTAARAGS